MEMIEPKIRETFELSGENYRCIESQHPGCCGVCCFKSSRKCSEMKCSGLSRKDKKYVFFEKI